jgi:hypothetical protein
MASLAVGEALRRSWGPRKGVPLEQARGRFWILWGPKYKNRKNHKKCKNRRNLKGVRNWTREVRPGPAWPDRAECEVLKEGIS